MSDRVTILHLGEGEDSKAWKQALLGRPWELGEAIKKDGEREVWRTTLLGTEVSFKVRPANRLRAMIGLTDFARAVRGAKRLARAKVATPPVRIHAIVGDAEVLVHPWIQGPTLLSLLAAEAESDRSTLLEAAGQQIGLQLRAVLFNRDCKPSNMICVSQAPVRIVSVDVGGVRYINTLGLRPMERAFARMCACLVFEPEGVGAPLTEREVDAALEAAALVITEPGLRGASGNLPHNFRGKAFSAFRDLVASHGDATPKVNPLDTPGF